CSAGLTRRRSRCGSVQSFTSVAARPPSLHPGLLTEQQLGNDAGRDGDQHVVAAYLHPLIAAWRRVQAVRAPVVHHVLRTAIFRRNTAAAAPLGAACAVVVFGPAVAAEVAAVAHSFAAVAPVVVGATITVPVAPIVIALLVALAIVVAPVALVALRERKRTDTQRRRRQCTNDGC